MEKLKLAIEMVKYSITHHSGKLAGIDSISTDRRKNKNCEKYRKCSGSICQNCYVSNHEYKSNLMRKLAKNHTFYTTYELRPEDVPYWITKYGRFESFADLNNELQFKNYCLIAECNPQSQFAIWTKNPWIIKSAIEKYNLTIPENMNIGYSSIIKNRMTNIEKIKKAYPFITFIFTVYDKDYAKKHNIKINCGSRDCIKCGLCYEKHDRNCVLIVNELKK